MTDIDYESLGNAAWRKTAGRPVAETARAVVAALREQGLVVVRADALRMAIEILEHAYDELPASIVLLIAALAAPGDGKETP